MRWAAVHLSGRPDRWPAMGGMGKKP